MASVDRLRVLTASLLLFSVEELRAVITSDRPGTHLVNPGRPAFDIDLDGVALIAGDVSNSQGVADLLPLCTGALITDQHVLSAAHCYDNDRDGQLDSLFRGFPHVAAFELADRTELLRIDANKTLIPDKFGDLPADIAVLELEGPAPREIPRYPLYAGFNLIGAPVVIAGYGAAGDGKSGVIPNLDGRPIKRAGLNRIEAIRDGEPFPGLDLLTYDFDSGRPDGNVLQTQLDIPSDLGFGDDEVLAARGDSGGPVFYDGAIVAVSAYGGRLDDQPDQAWGAFAFDVPVATFQSFIRQATNGQARFVPEPTVGWRSIAVLCWALAFRLTSRTRRRT